MYVCDNCGKRYEHEEDLKIVFPNIPGLLERIEPGGTVPAGECPGCGFLVYPDPQPPRVLILLDGGLVQGVFADTPALDVAVLDEDTEGTDEESDEIVDVAGDGYDLRGTMQAHEVTVTPTLIESAWRPVDEDGS